MRMLRNGNDIVLVYQAEAPADAATLVFESTGVSIHLRQFPADWKRLTDAELLRLRLGRAD